MTAHGEVRIVTNNWQIDGLADPPNASVVGTPARRPSSLRRTAHLSACWPKGFGTPVHLLGRARDLVTSATGQPQIGATGTLDVDADTSQTVMTVKASPGGDGIEDLIGKNAIRGFRSAVEAAVPQEREGTTPLVFLLDDVPPVSMIGGIAWSQHRLKEMSEHVDVDRSSFQQSSVGTVACSGLRPEGYHDQSLDKGIMFPHWLRPAGDLSVDDEWAWHEIEIASGAYFRRRRRMDIWRSGSSIIVEAHHRDSVWGPDGGEIALHEYSVTATLDSASHLLTGIDVTANVLPFPECPLAANHLRELVGKDVSGLRAGVHKELIGLHACTHLNDMVRGFSDVPALAEFIPAR